MQTTCCHFKAMATAVHILNFQDWLLMRLLPPLLLLLLLLMRLLLLLL